MFLISRRVFRVRSLCCWTVREKPCRLVVILRRGTTIWRRSSRRRSRTGFAMIREVLQRWRLKPLMSFTHYRRRNLNLPLPRELKQPFSPSLRMNATNNSSNPSGIYLPMNIVTLGCVNTCYMTKVSYAIHSTLNIVSTYIYL